MTPRSLFKRAATVALVVATVAVVAGAVVGQPVVLSFVETGSMAPTLNPGDGFVAIPAPLAGPLESGDVVTFEAERLHGGGLVTHRIVGESPRGYVTQGDANTFTDQSGAEPPVQTAQIVAVALQFDGNVVVIPNLGTAIQFVQRAVGSVQRFLAGTFGLPVTGSNGLVYLVFVGALVYYAVDVWRERRTKSRGRENSKQAGIDTHLLLVGLVLLVVVAATASMTVPARTETYEVVSAEFDAPGARVIPMGQTETTVHPVGNGGVLPVVVYLEPSDAEIDIEQRRHVLASRERRDVTVKLTAPAETGYFRHHVVEHRYLAILPIPVITTLYTIHPWLPILVVDVLVGVPFYLLGLALLGTARIRHRSRKRATPTGLGRVFKLGR